MRVGVQNFADQLWVLNMLTFGDLATLGVEYFALRSVADNIIEHAYIFDQIGVASTSLDSYILLEWIPGE